MRGLRVAILATLALAVVWSSPACAETIGLLNAESVRILDRSEVAAGRPMAAQVLSGTADFRPYSRGMLAGWPVDAWLRFRIAAPPGRRWLLQLPETEWARLYLPGADGRYESQLSGTGVAFDDRSQPYTTPTFWIRPGIATYYLHVVYHPDLPFAPTVRETSVWYRSDRLQLLVEGLFFGVLLTLIAMGTYVVAVLHYKATGLFTVYLVALVVNELVTTGLANQYLWPGAGGDARLATFFANTLAYSSFVLFVRTLLSTRRRLPRLDVLLWMVFGAQIAVAILQYATPLGPALIAPLLGIQLAGSALILAMGFLRWRQGSLTGGFFVVAFTPAAFGALANIAYDALLPAGNWFWAANGVEFGTMIECVMMAAIVLNRINLVHRESLTAKTQLTLHERQNSELRHIALTDPLTGVANRLRFYEEVGPALQQAGDSGGFVGVLYADVDDFKRVNDQSGHMAGDELLRSVAHRLQAVAREQDLVARLGGDEFAVLLRRLPSISMLELVRERVIASFTEAHVAISVGASLFPRDGKTPDEMIDAADRAMYQAKQTRKAAQRSEALR